MLDNIIKNIENASGGEVTIQVEFTWTRKTDEGHLEFKHRFMNKDFQTFGMDGLASMFGVELTDALREYKGG